MPPKDRLRGARNCVQSIWFQFSGFIYKYPVYVRFSWESRKIKRWSVVGGWWFPGSAAGYPTAPGPNSKYWHAAWRDKSGRLHLQSTKETDRQKAMSFAIEIERAQKLAGADSLVEAADGEWKAVILLGFFTGARLSDCCRME